MHLKPLNVVSRKIESIGIICPMPPGGLHPLIQAGSSIWLAKSAVRKKLLQLLKSALD